LGQGRVARGKKKSSMGGKKFGLPKKKRGCYELQKASRKKKKNFFPRGEGKGVESEGEGHWSWGGGTHLKRALQY